ncbi:hypothetical protein BCR37DRAFT_377918 [Protomyces lactucae-debilis]|uniref:Secreted protein n=1 Tax=Protomyces lactucae-debilis TaxID=2754530 RepID=A0A1Y2FM06_PROLT|nr:uncharacterized protein BCR37DRAFT_377918 [Protomyces lactucae-debilis]ORY84959.1 hypothetical protein BCR37DRAFT_377918 [Protomyces lactucae-debilis]
MAFCCLKLHSSALCCGQSISLLPLCCLESLRRPRSALPSHPSAQSSDCRVFELHARNINRRHGMRHFLSKIDSMSRHCRPCRPH